MNRVSDKRKSMAALAVFRDMYNKKKDVYEIISEFAKLAIVENALATFELQKMVNIIRGSYGLVVPSAVVKNALSRLKFLDKTGTQYTIIQSEEFDADTIKKDKAREEEENQRIIDNLNAFVEERLARKLSSEEAEILCNDFCSFVIDDTVASDYAVFIEDYIIRNSNNIQFVEQLEQIKQGVICFVGYSYNSGYNGMDKIDIPLNIYLDTELLFHMSGLNGTIYQMLFDEFYDLVTEINEKANKNVIRLLFFSESQDEVNYIFSIAERIVRKEEQLNPSRQAVVNIVNGCEDPSDVIEKRRLFWKTVADKNIELDPQQRYYDKEANYEFMIHSESFYNYQDDEISEKDIDRKVKFINYILVKRGYKSHELFRSIGHVLLSANMVTFLIAHDPSILKPNTVPTATNLSFLTNRFWLSLNKNLTDMSKLKSISVITKAQVALSTKINDSVGKLYKEYISDDKRGTYDVEKSKAFIAELFQSVVNPDDLTPDTSAGYMGIMSVNDVNSFMAEKVLAEEKRRNETEVLRQEYEKLEKEKKESDKLLAESNLKREAALLKAAEVIAASRNKTNKDDYDSALIKYQDRRRRSVEDSMKKLLNRHIKVACSYSVVLIALFIISKLFLDKKTESCIVSLIVYGLEFILFLCPFIRPLLNHEPVLDSFKFIFTGEFKEKERARLKEEFTAYDKEPQLTIVSVEEVLVELRETT